MDIDDKLIEFRDKNPFRVPDGFFESFAENMMNRLPDLPAKQPEVISIYDRVKPWLYMAAVFAGLIILFNVLNKTLGVSSNDNGSPEKATLPVSPSDSEAEENDEFLEYIEDMYTDKYALSYIDYFMDN
jgi:hypothetical protein